MVFLTGPPPRSHSLKSLDFFWSYFFDPPLLRVVVCSAVFFPLVRQQKGFTPLHEASRYGHVRVVQMLLRFYETPDPEGKVRPGSPLPRSPPFSFFSSSSLLLLCSSPPSSSVRHTAVCLPCFCRRCRPRPFAFVLSSSPSSSLYFVVVIAVSVVIVPLSCGRPCRCSSLLLWTC